MLTPTDVFRKTMAPAALLLFGLSGVAAADGAAGHEGEGHPWSAAPAFAGPTLADDAVNPITTLEGDPGDREGGAVAGEVEIPRDFAGIVGRYLVFPAPVPTDYLRTIRMFDPDQWDTAEGLQPAAPPLPRSPVARRQPKDWTTGTSSARPSSCICEVSQ